MSGLQALLFSIRKKTSKHVSDCFPGHKNVPVFENSITMQFKHRFGVSDLIMFPDGERRWTYTNRLSTFSLQWKQSAS